MTVARPAFAGTLAILLAGCINSATLITVKPDGSGTVEQTMLMSTQALTSMLAGMGGMGAGRNGQKDTGSLFSEAEIKRQAERLGKGVRFVSSEPIKGAKGFEGVKAVFAFDDINAVQVSQDPQVPESAGGGFGPSASRGSPVLFKLARGAATSVLTITFPEDPSTDTGTDAADRDTDEMPSFDDPAMMAMVKSMFQGFRISVDLEVAGTIVKTNADHVTGSRLTLLEIDMGAILENEAQFKALQSKARPGASLADIRPLLRDVQGVKINEPVVTVEFR